MDVCGEVFNFYNKFNGEKQVIGESFLGFPIYAFTVRKTDYPKIIVQYGMHAREYITTLLSIRHIKNFYRYGNMGTVYFIPAVNPDGIKISEKALPLYKANARGVDLNVNFGARWGEGKSNVKTRGKENYVGKYPFSEPETKALKNFTLLIEPQGTLSFHSKGEEIYFEFFQDREEYLRDKIIAEAVAKKTGYVIKSTPNSSGGYKDWCISTLKIPSLTIEVGRDELTHPIKREYLNEIYSKTKGVISTFIKEVAKSSICR